jgi:hypothetical protein
MFNDKPYSEVNREERFFCFLLSHALLMSKQVRSGFADIAKNKCNATLDPDNLEVYVEAAALRDYWRDLGDPVIYSNETHSRRRALIEQIFELYNLHADLIDQNDLFWTSSKKLWNPNHWSIDALKKAALEQLIEVKWAFNAKPDILLISPEAMLVIEAKVESPEGCNAEIEYKQFKIQELIINLWKHLIPNFQKRTIDLALLEVNATRSNSITWSEILKLTSTSDIDDFTRQSMASLSRYYKKS